jgi:hypothetical protein
MADDTVEISVKGKWYDVPALHVNGCKIIAQGRWLKVAVIDAEEWLATEIEDPEACIETLNRRGAHGFKADIFTFAQKLPGTFPKYSYPIESESVAAIHVTSFKDWWDKLPQESRKNVRRSKKRGVVVKVKRLDDDLVREIVEVNNDSPLRQKRPYAHYQKTFDEVKKDQSTFVDRSDFICAYLGTELIGFAKVVHRRESASILQFLPKASRYDARPANALIATAVELCEAKGLSYLTYGKYHYGNQGATSLNEFKARNGFEEVVLPRYYIPLTAIGQIAMTLGLHRGLLGMFPRSIIRLGSRMRSEWYKWRLSTGRCSSMAEQPKL